MTGTSTPRLSRSFRIISGTAAAACSVFTVIRTSCDPACARRAVWIAVASGSAVSVFVIDWTTIGWALPTRTPPTSTDTVERRRGRRASVAAVIVAVRLRAAGQDPDDVEAAHPDQEREQEREPDDVRQPLRADADPLPEHGLQDDHQHPATIEGWERQAVHEGEVGRQDAGNVESQDRAGAEEHVGDLRRDPDRARDRRRRRRVRDDLTGEVAQAAENDREPPRRLTRTDCDRGGQVTGVGPVEDDLQPVGAAADPERSLRRPARDGVLRGGVDLGLGPEGDLDVLDPAVGMLDPKRDGLLGVPLEIREDAAGSEELVRTVVH